MSNYQFNYLLHKSGLALVDGAKNLVKSPFKLTLDLTKAILYWLAEDRIKYEEAMIKVRQSDDWDRQQEEELMAWFKSNEKGFNIDRSMELSRKRAEAGRKGGQAKPSKLQFA